MCTGKFHGTKLRRYAWGITAQFLLLSIIPTPSRGQALPEAAATTSSSATSTGAVAETLPPSLGRQLGPQSADRGAATEAVLPDSTKGRDFEQPAGTDGAKVLLRSIPSGSATYIDGTFEGRTPLLLILPPGKYKVQMRGERGEFAERLFDVSPNETQQVALRLAERYPARVTAFARNAAPSTEVATIGTKDPLALSGPESENNVVGSAEPEKGVPADVSNRRMIEQQAGKDASKLFLKSAPDQAQVYIDGVFVGRTPLELVVSPGKYRVTMLGRRGEHGERLVGVLPNETQPVFLTLIERYPASVSVRWPMGDSKSR